MKLIARPALAEDFAEFYRKCFFKDLDNEGLRCTVRREWDILLRNPTTISLVIEDEEQPAGNRLLGCAQAVFISERFADLLRTQLPPWANVYVTRPFPDVKSGDGSWPFLTPLQVAQANVGDGVHVLVTRWNVAWQERTPEEGLTIRRFLISTFTQLTQCFKVKEIFMQATGYVTLQEALAAGFEVIQVDAYRRHYEQNPPMPPPESYPHLLHVTRQMALDKVGILAGLPFAYTPPRYGFRFTHKHLEVLTAALAGAYDEEIARSLKLSVETIRKRWQGIYIEVEGKAPGLLPEASRGQSQRQPAQKQGQPEKRGRPEEKRRVLLRYLAQHPEELFRF